MRLSMPKSMICILICCGLLILPGCGEEASGPLDGHDHGLSQTAEGEHPHTTPDGEIHESTLEITDEVLEEIDLYLEMLAYGLIDLSDNQDFIDILQTKVDEQFDGDDNVLFRDLKTACDEEEIDLQTLMATSIEAHAPTAIREHVNELGTVLEAITFEGEGFYPQIYIPFYTPSSAGQSPAAILPLVSDVYEVADEGPGYALIYEDGVTTGYYDKIVSADWAEDNRIWVVSINERVNYKGDLTLIYRKNKRGTDCPPTKWFEFFPKMNILDRKETWPAGKTEIYFGFAQYDQADPSNPTRWTDEKFIKKIKKKNIGDEFDIHLEFTNDWAYCDQTIALIIYERDVPSGHKTWNYETTASLEFQSKQSDYWHGLFHESDYFYTGPWQGVVTSHTDPGEITFSMRGREN